MNLLQKILGHTPSTKENPSELPYVPMNKKTSPDVKKLHDAKSKPFDNTSTKSTPPPARVNGTSKSQKSNLTAIEQNYLDQLKPLVKKHPRDVLRNHISKLDSSKLEISNQRFLELLDSLYN